MSDVGELKESTKVAAGEIMRNLQKRRLSNIEAINAMLLATIVSAQMIGLDKQKFLNNISENWDLCEVQEEEVKH